MEQYESFYINLESLFIEQSQKHLFISPNQQNLHRANSSLPACIHNFDYILCNESGHESEPLSMVCTEKGCANRTIICAVCESEQHIGHNTIPLKYYLNKIYGQSYNSGPQAPAHIKTMLTYTQILNQQKSQAIQELRTYRQKLSTQLHEVETSICRFYDHTAKKMKRIFDMGDPLGGVHRILGGGGSGRGRGYVGVADGVVGKVKQYFKSIVDFNDIDTPFNLEQCIQGLLSLSNNILQPPLHCLTSTLTSSLDSTSSLQTMITSYLQTPESQSPTIQTLPTLKFSDKLKGHKFVIKNDGKLIEQSGMESNGQRFALMDVGLGRASGVGGKVWGIGVVKLVGWAAVGVCLKKYVSTSAKYTFNYSSIGHGSYLVAANGYSWSHSKKELNSVFKSFTYTVGDTVYIKFSPEKKKIFFVKNKNQAKFQLQITDAPEGDEYCPCVNLCSSGDSVQIVPIDDVGQLKFQ